jgi:tetratricopeptide (TPR) repeat protein
MGSAMRHVARRRGAAAALVVVLGAAHAFAEPDPRELYERGTAAYREGRYDDAIALLAEAHRLEPHAELAYDLGRAYERKGDLRHAVASFREYLALEPAAQDRAIVEARVAELLDRMEPTRTQVIVATRSSDAAAGVAGEKPSRAETGERSTVLDRVRLPTWIAFGAGIASLGTSVAFLVAEHNAEDDARAAPTQIGYRSAYQAAERDRDGAWVFFGIGAAAMVAGGVLLTLDLTRRPAQRAAGPDVRLELGVLRASLSGAF